MTGRLFFGTGSGRCGTMALANLLNSETGVKCLHEGKERNRETPGTQWLPFLTLENIQAYWHPDQAQAMLEEKRRMMPALRGEHSWQLFGDIAYNYAPFLRVLPRLFPEARLLVLYRDGRHFVRSAYMGEREDDAPVGWTEKAEQTDLERFIALGRLRPQDSDQPDSEWAGMSVIAKNAWLWAETNRLIFDGLDAWPKENVLILQFETLFRNLADSYRQIRGFLGIDGPLNPKTEALLHAPVNRRASYVLPEWDEWSMDMQEDFRKYAGEMMARLGYMEASTPQQARITG